MLNWYAWVFKGTIVLAIAGAIFAFGYRTAENKLQPEINMLKANLLAIDLQAKKDEIKYKENLDAIQKKSKHNRAAIDDYYLGLLSKTPNHPSPGKAPGDTSGVDAAPGESTSAGLDIEKNCMIDALRVIDIAVFFQSNNFPISP